MLLGYLKSLWRGKMKDKTEKEIMLAILKELKKIKKTVEEIKRDVYIKNH